MKSSCISFPIVITNEREKGKVKNDRQSNEKQYEKALGETWKKGAEVENMKQFQRFGTKWFYVPKEISLGILYSIYGVILRNEDDEKRQ